MSGGTRPDLTRAEGLALGAALALAAALMWPLRGYLTDDTFIHLQVARHLAAGDGPVFNAGERVYGSTSPFWVGWLAAAMAAGLDGLAWARATGAVATLVSIVLMLQLLRQTVRTPALRAAGTIAWAGHAWMLRWAFSGMETPLGVLLVLAGFVAFTAGEPWGRRAALTGVCWSLAALTRPEAALLLAMWGGHLLLGARAPGGLRRLAAGALGPLLLYGGWLLFARGFYGSFWPQTLAAKTAGGVGIGYHLWNLWRQARIVGASDAVPVLMLVLALLVAWRRAPAGPRALVPARLLPWGWVLGLPLLYAARGVPVLSRYLVPTLPILAWLAWRAAEHAWGGSTAHRRRVVLGAALVAALMLAQNLAVYRVQVLPHVRTFSPALERSLIAWGRWFERHTAPEAVIATPDIGAIGYYSRRRVVDLAGLVTPAMVPVLEREEQELAIAHFAFAAFSRPEYLVDRAPARYRLLTASPYADCLTPLGEAHVPNLGVSQPGPVVYSFYKVDWTVYDSLSTRR